MKLKPLLACACLPVLATAGQADAAEAGVRWQPCQLGEIEGAAECTTVSVPENRARPRGRQIVLKVARLLPLGGGPTAPDPIFVLQGGPGQSAVKLADFYGGRSWAPARRSREIILVDQRGTGSSNALDCDLGGRDEDPQTHLYELFPEAAVRACWSQVRHRADPSLYTTEAAVLDLDTVRRRLGFRRINLYGTSYGTRVALRYLERVPQNTRSLVLKGVVDPGTVAPATFAQDTDRALELLFSDCAADGPCNSAFPALRSYYALMRSRLRRGPVSANVKDGNGALRSVTLTEGVVSASIRSILQSVSPSARLPALIHAAGNGDYSPLAETILQFRTAGAAALSTGLMLSVICAEDAPFLPASAGLQDERTLLRGYWVERVRRGCAAWPVPADRAKFRTMSRHLTPALLISGELDPATPPANAERARQYLPNSTHVVVPKGSHGGGIQGCLDGVIANFLDTLKPAELDAGCAAAIRRPPFFIPAGR
jgi:pimeloyl-ACP methyl ester carboxylesterase